MVLSEQESLLSRWVDLPRRVLLGVKKKQLQAVEIVAEEALTDQVKRLNRFGPEPDITSYEKAGVAQVFSLMLRAISRQRIESEGRANFPGRPKQAARVRGEGMSQARGARN